MSKTLVAFFSASGVTAKVAENLAKAASADICEIKPAVPYTSADLNWQDKQSRSSVEMKDKSSRPEITDKNTDVSAYDKIFLGFPIWWYTAPTIINTCLESGDFAGKEIILFATCSSSGFGSSVTDLKKSVPESTVIKEGKILNGNPSVDELKAWVDTL